MTDNLKCPECGTTRKKPLSRFGPKMNNFCEECGYEYADRVLRRLFLT